MKSKNKLNAISLFSGIGGFELGLHDYCRTLLYCESDKHAQAVLLSRMSEGAIDNAPICNDVKEINSEFVDIPIDIIFGGFPCFVKDTMVFTKDGYKAIQDIQVGEYVLTHKRRWRQVNQKHMTENRQIRFVKGTGFLPTETTDEHPYYVRKSKQIWDNSQRRYKREFDDPRFTKAEDIKGSYIGLTYPPDEIEDTHSTDFWWLIGRCIADGCLIKCETKKDGSYSRVVIPCVRHRKQELEDNISKCYDFICHENNYYINNQEFANCFSKAGFGALNKHIPNEWLMLPKEKLIALLDGYFSKDGSSFVSKSGREGRRCTTVSKRLALTLQMAILKCYGVAPSLYEVPETTMIEGNQHAQYQVQYTEFNRSSYVDLSGEYGWGNCRKSNETNKFETVYNIAVEEDESYIANGAIVSNCQDISCAGKGVGLEGERSGLFFEIVRLAREIKPTFLFLENVSAIRTRGLDRIILELTEIGYDLRWCMLSASDVGAPHRRERWFLLAAKRDALADPESICDRGELRDILSENAEIGQSEEQHQDPTRESESTSELSTFLANTDQSQCSRLSERETKAHTTTRECSQNQTGALADTESGQPREQTERQGRENPRGRSEDCRRLEDEGRIDKGAEQLANANNEGLERSETARDARNSRQNTHQQPSGCSAELANANLEEGYEAGLQSRSVSKAYSDRWGKEGSPRPTESDMGRMVDGFSTNVVEIRKDYLDPNYWKEEPEGVPRVTNDREQRVERIKRLGNAVVPLQARTAFEYLMGIYKENNPNLIMPMPLIIPKQRPMVEYEELEW